MSVKTITKEVQATVCDACHKEIDKAKGYCYHHLVSTSKDAINSKEYKVTHYLFSWAKPKKDGSSEYIQYDFHPECLDKIIRKFINE